MLKNDKFRKFTKITIFFTIFVVFAGSMVKVTGSGMGCPDWPKCFGYIIPPFSEEKLEWKTNFEFEEGEMIIVHDTLWVANSNFSTQNTFNRANWVVYDTHDYHAYKPIHTIIEYVNRLVSVLLGAAVLLMIFFSFKSKENRILNIIFAFFTFLLIGFEAWLGKLVVEGVLNPTDISFHMLVAFLIILSLSFIHTKNASQSLHFKYPRKYIYLQTAAFAYLMYQLIMGVVLRQTFDTFSDISREKWVDEAGVSFLIHRSSSLIYVALTVLTWRVVKEFPKPSFEYKNFIWVIILTIGEIISGAVMGYLEVPKAAQPFHVIVSSILLLVQANLFFKIFTKKQL